MTTFMNAGRLGIDFGTSNSAAAVLANGRPFHIDIEAESQTLPTSIFFDFVSRETKFGSVANAALINGDEGRFMRSLKSVLGTSLMHEPRQIMDEQLTFVDIISRFLRMVKTRAEQRCMQEFHTAVSGRPVHFHSADPGKDEQALKDLTQCYHAAGFTNVEFVFEPEAAAIANGAEKTGNGLGLIVDIGGGTSDFSIFQTKGSDIEILASHGVRIGGTNFDRAISVDHVMPLFGRGSQIRREMGPGLLTAPNAIFNDLATWEKIPFLYNGQTRRDVHSLARLAVDRRAFERLETVLELEVGHDIAFAVERGKIAANQAGVEATEIKLDVVEKGLCAPLSTDGMARSLAGLVQGIRECARETLDLAGSTGDDINRIVFVGGSSLMSTVEGAMSDLFPTADLEYSDAFTAVVDGLAIVAAKGRDG